MSLDSDNVWEIRNYTVGNTGWTRIDLSGFWSFRLQLVKGGMPIDGLLSIAVNPGIGATSTGTGGTFQLLFGAMAGPTNPGAMNTFDGAHFPTINSEWYVLASEGDCTLQVIGIRRFPAR